MNNARLRNSIAAYKLFEVDWVPQLKEILHRDVKGVKKRGHILWRVKSHD